MENQKLYLQLVDFAIQQNAKDGDEASVLKVFEEAITSELPAEQKMLFSQRKLEFYEDFGTDVKKLQEAYDEHARYIKIAHQDKKKRGHPDDKSDEANKEKKAKIEANGISTSPVPANTGVVAAAASVVATATAAAATTAAAAATATTDHAAYSYQTAWPGYTQVAADQQSYNYHQAAAWNPYGQHYYTGH